MRQRTPMPGRITLAIALLATAVLVLAAGLFASTSPAHADDTLVTPEGVTINVYVDTVTAEEVYDVLLANGLEPHVKLVQVDVVDDGLTMASVGGGCYPDDYPVQGCWVYDAKIQVRDDLYLARPNYAIGHEYGHVWENYHRWKNWEGQFDAYLKARGLADDDRVGSNKCWQPYEMIAEDYRQLFGAGEALTLSQCNRDIPAAPEVPGLRDFLALTWTSGDVPPNYGAGDATPTASPEPTSTPTPTPTVTPAPTTDATPDPTATPTPTPTPEPPPEPTPTQTTDPAPGKKVPPGKEKQEKDTANGTGGNGKGKNK